VFLLVFQEKYKNGISENTIEIVAIQILKQTKIKMLFFLLLVTKFLLLSIQNKNLNCYEIPPNRPTTFYKKPRQIHYSNET